MAGSNSSSLSLSVMIIWDCAKRERGPSHVTPDQLDSRCGVQMRADFSLQEESLDERFFAADASTLRGSTPS